jgi:starvation-inducible DNA-binding protein
MQVGIGIEERDRTVVAGQLARLLADSYTLYLKTHNFHWNVTGPMFPALHAMFEQQYLELATAVDEIAERIRTLGQRAPATYAEFLRLGSLDETEGVPKANGMVQILLEGHEAVAHTARAVLTAAQGAGDEGSADLATQRIQVHEKTAWMLRSALEL